MAESLSTHREKNEAKVFSWPGEPEAWWSFLSTSLVGMVLIAAQASARLPEAACLLLSMTSVFLASDWISALGGRGISGERPRSSLMAVPGWTLLLLAVLGLAFFFKILDSELVRPWVFLIALVGAATALIFLMRLQLLPLDTRLVSLSVALSTSPALLLSLLSLGLEDRRAIELWLYPAVYFPVAALFSYTWLRGLIAHRPSIAVAATPLLILFVAAIAQVQYPLAVFFVVYTARVTQLLIKRDRESHDHLPAFSEIRRLAREIHVWNALFVALWARLLLGI